MRTHEQIIVDAKGPAALAKAIGAESNVVKQWKRLSSIPAPYWNAIVESGLASLRELADGAEARREARVAAKSDQSAA